MPRFMVVGAHHDDGEWLVGGLALLLKNLDWHVRFVVMTNTAAGADGQTVNDEAQRQQAKASKSADILGIEKRFLGFPSCDDRVSDHELTVALAKEITEFEPDILACDWPRSAHPDHRRAGIAALTAARREYFSPTPRRKPVGEIICASAYTCGEFPADFVINITEHWDLLCRALKSFPEFENPRGNNLILSKEKYHIDRAAKLHWPYVETFALVKGHPEKITVLRDVLAGSFRWLDKHPARELVF